MRHSHIVCKDTAMALPGLRGKACLMISVIFMILFLLIVYENKLYVHQKSGSWRNVVSRYIQVPTDKKCLDRSGSPYLIPEEKTLRNMSEQELTNVYWRYINTIQTICRNQTRLGSFNDGGKEVCIDNKYRPSPPCLVYSFGSNHQFDFETAVKQAYHCEIHTFDPSMTVSPQRPIPTDITTFHPYGLDSKDFKNSKNWEMRNLTSIRKELMHEERAIDILKIDIEGGEWRAFPEIFQSGVLKYVKQICLEVHYGRQKKGNFWGDVGFTDQLNVLRGLYEHGFFIFMRERNLGAIQGGIITVNEISLINKNWVASK